MINDFVTRIFDLFASEIRFAYLMPLIIFLLSLFTGFSFIIGIDPIMALFSEWLESPLVIAFILVGFIVIMVSLAYFLYGISNLMVRFWSGEYKLLSWIFELGKLRHNYINNQYERIINDGSGNYWERIMSYFTETVLEARSDSNSDKRVKFHHRIKLWWLGKSLSLASSEDEAARIVHKIVISHFSKFTEQSTTDDYARINRIIKERFNNYLITKKRALYNQDQYYGIDIKGTSLGNIIEAYNSYSYKRYRIESDVFWSRIQSTLSDDIKNYLQAQKAKLDFFITATTLSLTLCTLCLGIPFLTSNKIFFIGYLIIHVILTIALYNAAVHSASIYGNTARSCYDLFRFDLIKKLHLKIPSDSDEEKRIWEAYSQLVAYSEAPKIVFEHEIPADDI